MRKHVRTTGLVKAVGIKDMFERYPYKKNIPGFIPGISKTTPIPYVKKADVSDHKYAVDPRLYKKIVYTFFDFLFQYLLEGGRYKMPGRLGDLIIYKYKRSVKKNIRWHIYKDTGEHSNEKNVQTNRYSPTLKWKRNGNLSYRSEEINWWNWLPSRGAITKIGKYLAEDTNRIYNYQTYNRK